MNCYDSEIRRPFNFDSQQGYDNKFKFTNLKYSKITNKINE